MERLKNPIVVDLDGTLVKTDLLLENILLFLNGYPLRFFNLIVLLFSGKAVFKRYLAEAVLPDVTLLPYNKEFLDWLIKRRAEGVRLVLATASHKLIADKVAAHLNVFDEVIGTEETNLASKNKRDLLVQRYGEHGFEYVGNSSADLPVWKSASVIHVVNPESGVLTAAQKIGPIGMLFDNRRPYYRVLIKSLRLHQWVKNLLIFVPLLASHRVTEGKLLWSGLVAFVSFGTCASSIYLINDLLDLQNDRRHATKCNRPLASGSLPILHALFLIPILLSAVLAMSLWLLPIRFAGMLIIYTLLAAGYSLRIKRVVMLDVITLASLYTLRVLAGVAAMSLIVTFWILAFCLFIFLSLAFLKRYTELRDAHEKHKTEETSGRGYYPCDFDLLATLGGASGYTSVLVLALYINEAADGKLYRSPEWMWVACPLLLYWLSRVWLLAHRGQMQHDPIVFALRDRVSWGIALCLLISFAMATL
jgi:4-hydroxybenzoate polyprenyltransferase/phosphoserine phosphatase